MAEISRELLLEACGSSYVCLRSAAAGSGGAVPSGLYVGTYSRRCHLHFGHCDGWSSDRAPARRALRLARSCADLFVSSRVWR